MGLVLLHCDVLPARSGAGGRKLARDMAQSSAAPAAVSGDMAAPPAARRLLEAWFGLRGLRCHPMSCFRSRWLDRWLHQRDPTLARPPVGPAQGSHRSVGAWLPAGGVAGS